MKRLTCEMCSSNDIIRENGMYVCQSCGTKYSVEDARKMMIDGPVDVSGSTVKLDQTNELKNLYEIARRAKNDGNSDNAQKYYEMILVKDASSWEANFYSVYFQTANCKIAEIQMAANRLSRCIVSVLSLIHDNVTDKDAQKDSVTEIGFKSIYMSRALYSSAVGHYNSIGESIRNRYLQEMVDNCLAAANICYTCGNYIVSCFGTDYGLSVAVPCWKEGISQHSHVMKFLKQKNRNRQIILEYVAKVQAFDASYRTPSLPTDGACYVATAVYGSYDCPEVWTLRRFRDYHLSKSAIGRSFIRLYYKVSPFFVRKFGHTKFFSRFVKRILDRFVKELTDSGYKNTPYFDSYN